VTAANAGERALPPDPVQPPAAEVPTGPSDAELLDRLARGWRAMRELDRHHVVMWDGRPGGCSACHNFAAALVRGARLGDILPLRCGEARAWLRDMESADGAMVSYEMRPQ
jgi:hypothetical protein